MASLAAVALCVVLRIPVRADPTHTVTLPNGLTLELLGVTTGDSIDRVWWKPDGAMLDAPPYQYLGFRSRTQPSNRNYELAVRIGGLKDAQPEASIDRTGKYYVSGPMTPYGDKDGAVPGVFAFVSSVPAAETSATFEFALGANEWKPVQSFKGPVSGPATHGQGPGQIKIVLPDNPARSRGGEPPASFYVHAIRGKTSLRLVAIDKQGKRHVSASGQWWGADRQTLPAVFPNVRPEDVTEYVVESQPYHRALFENIRLRPSPEAQSAATRWRAERLRKMEELTAADPQAGRRLGDAMRVLRSSGVIFKDADAWAAAVRDVAEVGPPAVPAVVFEMNRTARPYVRSNMAIVLRAIGDPRAVPGLAAALATTPFAPNDYGGSQIKDETLRRYISRSSEYSQQMGLSFGRPVNEISQTLEVLGGGHSEGDQHRRNNDRRLYEEAALRWTQWWVQNTQSVTAGLPRFRGAFDRNGKPVDLPATLADLERMLASDPAAATERVAGEWTRLHVAAAHGRLFEATLLIAHGAKADQRCYGWTPLHLAAAAGATDLVARLVEKKQGVDTTTPDGQTALHVALGLGMSPAYGWVANPPEPQIIRALLAAGADVNAKDAEGNTPLYAASAFNDRALVETLVTAGADLKASNAQGRTALHRAAECGAIEVADALLTAGADVNATDDKGLGPVHVAGYSIWYRDFNSPMIPMLLSAGAKVSLVAAVSLGTIEQVEARLKQDPSQVNAPAPKTESDDEVTSLQMAINRGDAAIVKLLLGHGADANAMRHGQTPLTWAAQRKRKDLVELLLAANADLEKFDSGQGTPLYWAASAKDVELTKLLLDRGADPNADGGGPLSGAMSVQRDQSEEQALPVVELLLARGADPNLRRKGSGTTPIFWAQPKLAEVLIRHGAKLDDFNEQGDTPLHTAAALQHDGTVRVLLANKVDPNVRSRSGQTPLHTAFKIVASQAVVEALLQGGADARATDKDGRTPLHCAVERAKPELLEQLLDAKADPNAGDHDGATALHLSAKLKRKEAVDLLLKRGADPAAKDKGGRTPADWAEDEEVRAMLTAKPG